MAGLDLEKGWSLRGAATNSATAVIKRIAAIQITTLALLPNFLFEAPLQFGVVRLETMTILQSSNLHNLVRAPAGYGADDDKAASEDGRERHNPRQQVKSLAGRRGQNLFAILRAEKPNYLFPCHPPVNHRFDLLSHWHGKLALRMIAIRDCQTTSALAGQTLTDFL
jgi:hypothetical protein